MKIKTKLLISLILISLFSTLSLQASSPNSKKSNDSLVKEATHYLEEVQQRWSFPGASVAIVKDGTTLYAGGVGVKEVGKEGGVDANTLFPIGSITKSFTAVVMASLVAEGKVKWHDKVKEILPDFQMYDKWVESNIEVQDLMLHSTGLKAQLGTNLASFGYNRDDIYKIFGILQPNNPFRDSYAYNNITFIIAGKVIEKCSGKSWEDNIRERIFIPLGMNDSRINSDEYESVVNRAEYHIIQNSKAPYLGATKVSDFAHFYTPHGDDRASNWLTIIGPAGSVSSTASDMAKYILFHINRGKVGRRQVVPKVEMDWLHTGQTKVGSSGRKYGLCWNVAQNRDYTIISHTGSVRGFTAIAAFLPKEKLGFVMLVNSNSPGEPRQAMLNRVIDLFMNYPFKDYSSIYFTKWLKKSVQKQKPESGKAEKKYKPLLPSQIVGVYEYGEPLGRVVVEERGDSLLITTGSMKWVSPLSPNLQKENSYTFKKERHIFPVTFEFKEGEFKSNGLNISFGNGERFGVWKRVQ